MARFGGVALDVTAEADDEIVDRAGIGILVKVPDVVQDGLSRHGVAAVPNKVAKEFGFHKGELESLLAAV